MTGSTSRTRRHRRGGIAAHVRDFVQVSLVAVLATVAAPRRAAASPIDTERLAAAQSKKGWLAMANFSGAYRSGNINRLELGNDGSIQYQNLFPAHRGHPWGVRPARAPLFFKDRWLLVTQIRWGQLNSNRFINSGTAHTRYTRMIIPRLGVEGFGQAQYNEFTLLESRLILGTATRVDVVHRKRIGLWASTGYMAEWEVNDIEPPAEGEDPDPHPARLLNHRWSSRLIVQLYLIEGKLVLQNSLYAQPLLSKLRDIRILDSAQLEGMLTDIFSIGASFELQYDSIPVRGVAKLDIMIASFFRVAFG